MTRYVLVLCVVAGLVPASLDAAPNYDISEIDGDGIDNDGDGYTDSQDTECGSHYQGFGRNTTGGAGGTVFWVDVTLGDIPAGSDPRSGTHDDPCGFKKAIDGSNRVVKFVNGGTITLLSTYIYRGSGLTIDGFSAPEPGVTFDHTHQAHAHLVLAPARYTTAGEYLLNHLRFDGLWDEDHTQVVGWCVFTVDGGQTGAKIENMILDHLTFRDDQDKFTLWGRIENVTLSNCLFYNSAKACLVSYYPGSRLRKNISLYHNVFAENNERNPQLRGWIENLDMVNNVIYDWCKYELGGYGMRIKNEPGEMSVDANIVNNYFFNTRLLSSALIYGSNPGWDSDENGPPSPPLPQGTVYTDSDMGQLWVRGNMLPSANLDHYCTVAQPLAIPAWAQVPTIPAVDLYATIGDVGMRYKDSRGQEVLQRTIDALTPRQVAGRHVFYNYCHWDMWSGGANYFDDGAIAPDKSALAGGGAATFANYTNYSRGINGIMVDLPDLPCGATAGDFAFKVGNDSQPDGWADAPQPASITTRSGEGVGGSDRVTIIWPDNAISNQWLQVTVLANSTTRLGEPDVFYFGNAIGETGNSPTDARVTPADVIGVRNNPHTVFLDPAGADDVYDFDRDRTVGPTDAIIARDNGTNAATALRLIAPP